MHPDNAAKSLASILKSDKFDLKSLIKKAQTIHDIEQKLKNKLDNSFSDKFELANITEDVAVLLTTSSAWATRLRYHIPFILNTLNTELNLKRIKTVRIKIAKTEPNTPATITKSNKLSNQSASVLSLAAESIQDEALKQSLLKIAQNT